MILRNQRQARDGELVGDPDLGDWLVAWHPPHTVPPGGPHGVNAFCVTTEDEAVVISPDGKRWGWPGGRPEGDGDWEQTLRRQLWEETCTTVRKSRLLGFTRSICVSGHEEGLVLVRAIWRADVEVWPWEARHEIAHRRLVPAAEILDHLWMEEGFEPIHYRALAEACLL